MFHAGGRGELRCSFQILTIFSANQSPENPTSKHPPREWLPPPGSGSGSDSDSDSGSGSDTDTKTDTDTDPDTPSSTTAPVGCSPGVSACDLTDSRPHLLPPVGSTTQARMAVWMMSRSIFRMRFEDYPAEGQVGCEGL